MQAQTSLEIGDLEFTELGRIVRFFVPLAKKNIIYIYIYVYNRIHIVSVHVYIYTCVYPHQIGQK